MNSEKQVSWMLITVFQGGGGDPLGQLVPISNRKTENLPLGNSSSCGWN